MQRVTLAADSALSGEFSLTYPGVGSTAPLAHHVSSEVLEAAVRALGSEIGGAITVSRARTGVRGYAWMVTFDHLGVGDRPQMIATNVSLQARDGGRVALQVDTLINGTAAISGTFELGMFEVSPGGNGRDPETTGPLSHDAPAWEVEAALEALDLIDDVSVDVELLDEGDRGRIFSVSWPLGVGNIPPLRVNGSGLEPGAGFVSNGTSSSRAVAYVNEVRGAMTG